MTARLSKLTSFSKGPVTLVRSGGGDGGGGMVLGTLFLPFSHD